MTYALIMVAVDPPDVRSRLREAFAWRGDSTDENQYADPTGWWRDPDLLRLLGPTLAQFSRRRRRPWCLVRTRGGRLSAHLSPCTWGLVSSRCARIARLPATATSGSDARPRRTTRIDTLNS